MKVEIIEQIMNIKSMSVQRISIPNNLPLNNNISGSVVLNSREYTIITTNYGLIKLPLIETLTVKQNISVGLYDMPDRANMVKLQVIKPTINGIDEQIYSFILKKNDINHQLRRTDDIVNIAEKNINERLYQLSSITDHNRLVNINLELNNAGFDKVFLDDNNIYIDINNRLYRVIEEVPNLKNILSIGQQSVFITINQEFNLKKDFLNVVEILPKILPIQPLLEILSIFSHTPQHTILIHTNYLEAYKSIFLPIFSNFKRANLHVRESRGSCKTVRFIFEFEAENGSLSIIDCLYISSNGSLSVVVRSDYEFTNVLKARFIRCFNSIIYETSLHGSISFTVQSNRVLHQFFTHTSYENYTYSI